LTLQKTQGGKGLLPYQAPGSVYFYKQRGVAVSQPCSLQIELRITMAYTKQLLYWKNNIKMTQLKDAPSLGIDSL